MGSIAGRLEEFTDNLAEPVTTSHGIDSRDSPEPPRPKPLPSKAPEEITIVDTLSQRDTNGELCKLAEVARAAC